MTIKVTKAVTKYGRVYAVGDIIDNPTGLELSLSRLFRWETVSDVAPSFTQMSKPELVQAAHDRGLDTFGLKKTELVDLLTE